VSTIDGMKKNEKKYIYLTIYIIILLIIIICDNIKQLHND
jgi:hypothetical protein